MKTRSKSFVLESETAWEKAGEGTEEASEIIT
jgi:hypothetical protein